MSNQMTLWNAESLGIAERLSKVTVVAQRHNKEKELVAEVLKLLPMVSKSGPSMKTVTGLSGEMLKQHARQSSDDLKQVLTHQAVALGSSPRFTGVAMRITKRGRVSMTWKPVSALSLEDYSAEELEKRLAELRANQAKPAQGELPNGEAKPEAKGNGKGKAAPATK